MFSIFKSKCTRTHMPKIPSALGILGMLGFLGFTGFIPMEYDGETIPTFFFFFGFFGWFGFYYHGRMSGTFIDERLRFNESRALSTTYKIAFAFILTTSVCVITAMNGLQFPTHIALSILIAAAGLSVALVGFFAPYLLYKYENEE